MPENKEGLFVSGKINSKNIYNGKNGDYYTLDIAVLGCRSLIPVSVGPNDFTKAIEGEPFSKRLTLQINKYGTTFSLPA